MIERLPVVAAESLAMRWSSGEQQRGPQCQMFSEDGKHAPLIVMWQVEEAVPGNQTLKPLPKREASHVCPEPLKFGKALLTKRDQCWGGIDSCDMEAVLDQVSC